MDKEIREILDNVTYWETCPDDYKEKIKNYLSSENENNNKDTFLNLVSKDKTDTIENVKKRIIKQACDKCRFNTYKS